MATAETQFQNTMQESSFWQHLDADKVVDVVLWTLRGYRWDPKLQDFTNKITLKEIDPKTGALTTKEIEAEPKLNEQGVLDVASELTPRIRNVYSGGTLNSHQLKAIRHSVADVLWYIMNINRGIYNLKVENFKSILFMVDDQLLLFLSRTDQGGFLNKIVKMFSVRENRNVNTTEMPQQSGGWGKSKQQGGLF